MKPRERKKKSKEILEYMAYHSGDRGVFAWVDLDVLLYDQSGNELLGVALLIGELHRMGLTKSKGKTLWDDVPLDSAEDVFDYCHAAEFRITKKGMTKIRPRDWLYQDESKPGFWSRFVHEWLKGIAVGCAITAFAWWLNWYFSKP